MSFAVKGKTSLVVEKEAIELTAKKYGWEVQYDTTIRNHDIVANGTKFDIVLKNPATSGRVYDVGINYSEDGKTAEFIYDKWDNSIEEVFGTNCGKFKNVAGVAEIFGNDPDAGQYDDFEAYFDDFCNWEEDGSLVYNGYDEEPWETEEA
tara:strand:+ start:2035 stop:2484 length:450 start_codon:yes stop_codon:yes gene_type:complete